MRVALIVPGFVHVMQEVLDAAEHDWPSLALAGHAGIEPLSPQSQVNVLPLFVQSVYCEHEWPPVPVGPLGADELLPHAASTTTTAIGARSFTIGEA